MRKRSLLILLFLVSYDASAFIMETSEPFKLRDADRAAVEKAACAHTGKPAVSIQGWRGILPGHRELSATVLCEDAVEKDAYRAYFHRGCNKLNRQWKCEPPVIALHTDVAGGGPYEIRVEKLSLDESLAGIKCLETIYAQNPQILNGAKRGKVSVLYAGEPEEGRPVIAAIETANECFWIEYPLQCRVEGAEAVPVKVTTGCIDE